MRQSIPPAPSPQGLFRTEVTEAHRYSWIGDISVAQPASHRLMTGVFGLMGLALLLFLSMGKYTRREHASGLLVPRAGLLEVRAPTAGIVTGTPKRQGDHVKLGDTVISLTSERSSAALGGTATAVAAQLNLQLSKISSDLEDLSQVEREQRTGLRNRIDLLHAQISRIDSQLNIKRQEVNSLNELLKKIQPLRDKGFISALQVQQQESASLDAQGQVEALTRQRLEIEQQISSLREQLHQLPLATQGKRNEFARKHAEISQALAENESQRASIVGAPGEGVIASMVVGPVQIFV